MRAQRPRGRGGDGEAQRGGLRRAATRSSICADCRRRVSAGERGAAGAGRGRCSSSDPTCRSMPICAKLAERGGIVEERITGVELPQPQRATAGDARAVTSSCSRPTTSCWVGRAGRATSAVGFRPTSPTPRRSAPRRTNDRPRGWPAKACWAGSPSTSLWCATRSGSWTPYAIELNLRKGGTTHPFLTLQFLTDGRYDATTALFLTADGREKHLVATDHLESPLLRGLRMTTCSTSSPATACTSTRPARPASCST